VLLDTAAAGAPAYAAAGTFAVGGSPVALVAADVDGDGLPDLRVTDAGGTAVVLRNTTVPGAGAATFAAAEEDVAPTPDPFRFTDQAGVARNAQVTSDSVTLSGLTAPAPISVTGGKYSIGCDKRFTAADGTVEDGESVCVRHTSSSDFGTDTDTTLTVGTAADTFTSTTVAGDTGPEPFAFIDVGDALMNTAQVSNAVTLRGFDGSVPLAVTGGDYSIGCSGTFTAAPGSIASGQTVCVRHTSAATPATATHTTLTAGGTADTFTSSTPAAPNLAQNGSFGAATLLALLAALALAARARRPR